MITNHVDKLLLDSTRDISLRLLALLPWLESELVSTFSRFYSELFLLCSSGAFFTTISSADEDVLDAINFVTSF